jgi:hypothetical protein
MAEAFPTEQIELHEGERIVGTEFRGGTRLVVAILTPVDGVEHVCGAETASGECQREVDSADELCWQHEGVSASSERSGSRTDDSREGE